MYSYELATVSLACMSVGITLRYVPYRGLFFLDGMGSLLKIYSGLLHEVRLWVAIAEIGTDTVMSRWPINV